jgi:hypothetical protein
VSFHPVTMYQFRCDGPTTRGQCPTVLMVHEDCDEEDSPLLPVATATPSLEGYRPWFKQCGWLLTRTDRLLCPEHVASMEYMVRADLEGLPFEEAGAA